MQEYPLNDLSSNPLPSLRNSLLCSLSAFIQQIPSDGNITGIGDIIVKNT